MIDYKPVGGVESVALYPADAVTQALFSQEGCEVEFRADAEVVEVELIDDGSCFEEIVSSANGVVGVAHTLTLVARRCSAEEWLAPRFLERTAQDGVIAVVKLCDGRSLIVGYSQHFGDEQPLRLESVCVTSGKELLDTPIVTIRLVSHDAALAAERLF